MKKIRYTTEQFIGLAQEVHGDRYDYTDVQYTTTRSPVAIRCAQHGVFTQRPNAHLSKKQGCPTCGAEQSVHTRQQKQPAFATLASTVHNGRYLYDSVTYINRHTPVVITCVVHGPFSQRPNDHLNGSGCPSCGSVQRASSNALTHQQFLDRANNIHDGVYDYSDSVYTSLNQPITIICTTHGKFSQTPNNHIYCASGCPKCSHTVSHKEQVWLQQQGVPDTEASRQVTIHIDDVWYKVDGYIESTNTIYEFWGDFWHGNPEVYSELDINSVTNTTFGYLYERTREKVRTLQQAGFNVVQQWENDFSC